VQVKSKGVEKLAFSTNISLYVENGTRYGQSYNARRIGTRMRSIEWCHFQRSANNSLRRFQGHTILNGK